MPTGPSSSPSTVAARERVDVDGCETWIEALMLAAILSGRTDRTRGRLVEEIRCRVPLSGRPEEYVMKVLRRSRLRVLLGLREGRGLAWHTARLARLVPDARIRQAIFESILSFLTVAGGRDAMNVSDSFREALGIGPVALRPVTGVVASRWMGDLG